MNRHKKMPKKEKAKWEKKLPKGTIVKMVNCAEATSMLYAGKLFETGTKVIDHYGTPVVFLEGVNGSEPPSSFFAAEFLEVQK